MPALIVNGTSINGACTPTCEAAQGVKVNTSTEAQPNNISTPVADDDKANGVALEDNSSDTATSVDKGNDSSKKDISTNTVENGKADETPTGKAVVTESVKVNGVALEEKAPATANIEKVNNSPQKEIAVDTMENGKADETPSGSVGITESVKNDKSNGYKAAQPAIKSQGNPMPFRGRQSNWAQPYAPRNSFRPNFDQSTEISRLNAEIFKMRQEAQIAHSKSLKMEKSIEAKTKANCEEAMNALLSDVFGRQIDLVKLQFALQEKEVGLQKREDWMQRTEYMLSEGQKFLKSELPEYKNGNWTDVIMQDLRAELASDYSNAYRHANLTLELRTKEMDIREEKVKILEKTWKTMAFDDLRKEIQEELELEREAEICDREWNKGFAAGKEDGMRENMAKVRQEGFINGYALAHQQCAARMQLKNGKLEHTSPKLDFIFNPAHPEHPLNIGMAIGKQAAQNSRSVLATTDMPFPRPTHGGPGTGPRQQADLGLQYAYVAAATDVRDFRNIKYPDIPLSDSTELDTEIKPKPRSFVEPSPPTMYEEFHGPPRRENGHVIYANTDALGNSNGNENQDEKKQETKAGKEAVNLIDL